MLIRLARLVRSAEAFLRDTEGHALKRCLQSCGVGVLIHPTAVIVHPQGLALGNNVTIGEGCFIHAEGGVQIRDNTELSRFVVICSSGHDLIDCEGISPSSGRRSWLQTVIGRDVRIGANACILRGARIGDGSIIGPGAVIRNNVQSCQIVRRDCDAVASRPKVTAAVNPIDPRCSVAVGQLAKNCQQTATWPNGRERHPRIVFVASSGRSGSMTIAKWLNGHERIIGRHEARLQLVQWSTELAEGRVKQDETLSRLKDLYLDGTVYDPSRVHVESDQKLYNLLPLLAEVFPQARFIWLLRSGVDVVASLVGRGWYAEIPGSFQEQNFAWWWKNWRVRGDRTNPPAAGWADMGQFEKCAWYWAHVNATIESSLDKFPEERVLRIRLEDIERESDRIISFCGVESFRDAIPITNSAIYERYVRANWSKQDEEAFERWCSKLMSRLYPMSKPDFL